MAKKILSKATLTVLSLMLFLTACIMASPIVKAQYVTCPNCLGTRYEYCSKCGGSGSTTCSMCHGTGGSATGYMGGYHRCYACFGTGSQNCSACTGTGKVLCRRCFGRGTYNDGTPEYSGNYYSGNSSSSKSSTGTSSSNKSASGNTSYRSSSKIASVTYTITYKLNGGKNNSKNPKKYKNTNASFSLKNPTRKGYTFKGWYTDKKLTKRITTIYHGSTGNKTLYAKWAKTYKITYELNKGKNHSKNPKTYTKLDSTFSLKIPSRKGYSFMGWYTNKKLTKKIAKIKKGSSGNKTLYAKWAKNYTITYKLSGGKNNSKNQKTYTKFDSDITLKSPTRNGYVFKGWYTDKKLTKKITKIKKGSSGNKTIYAKWAKIYTVKYILGGGKNDSKNPSTYTETDSAITLKNPTRKGYAFKGWYIDSGYKTKVTKIAKGSTGNKTFYAKWELNWQYKIKDGKATLTGCEIKLSGKVTVPSKLGGYPVTSIGYEAFGYWSSLTSITIPNGVTSIDSYAFGWCDNLTSVSLPDSLETIEGGAFHYCKNLSQITIPKGVKSFGSSAFPYCYNLKSITVKEGNPAFHSSGNCLIETKTKILISGCKTSAIPTDGSVTSIGESAFEGQKIDSITLPNTITSIGIFAFEDCDEIKNITIPKGVKAIENGAFAGCDSLSGIIIPDGVTSIGHSAFLCTNLNYVVVPDSVTHIGGSAFSDTPWYENRSSGFIYLGKVLYKYKGDMAQNSNITLRNDTKGITSSAFSYCYGLASVTIPKSVVDIGSGVFSACRSLASITVESGNPNYYSAGNCLIEAKTKTLVAGCKTSVIPNDGSVSIIGEYAFDGCRELKNITLPSCLKSIDFMAFYNCDSLESVNIPEGVVTIDSCAFSGCSKLTSITIPDSVTSIGFHAFDGCCGVTSIKLGNHIESIDEEAFRSCSNLKSITIPKSVTYIGRDIFDECNNLTDVYYTGTAAQWSNIEKAYNPKLSSVNIHYGK